MKIFSGTNNILLSQHIVDEINQMTSLELTLGSLSIDRFSDGEICPVFYEDIEGNDVVFINTIDTSDSIIETFLVADAATRAGCRSFILVSPYLAYSRQDKLGSTKSSLGAKVLADILINRGVDFLITMDLHSITVQDFYNIPVSNLNGNKIFQKFFIANPLNQMCIVAPDKGALSKASSFCELFPTASFAYMNKLRVRPNEIHSLELIGVVKAKNVVIIDDMADTLGTLKNAAQLVMDQGAISVRAVATHGVLSGPALLNLQESMLTELIVSDTLLQNANSKIRVISSASILAKEILDIVQ